MGAQRWIQFCRERVGRMMDWGLQRKGVVTERDGDIEEMVSQRYDGA